MRKIELFVAQIHEFSIYKKIILYSDGFSRNNQNKNLNLSKYQNKKYLHSSWEPKGYPTIIINGFYWFQFLWLINNFIQISLLGEKSRMYLCSEKVSTVVSYLDKILTTKKKNMFNEKYFFLHITFNSLSDNIQTKFC